MITRCIIIALLSVTSITDARAQANTATKGLGLAAGRLSGSGFSYRDFPNYGWGYQLSGIYIRTEDYTFLQGGVEPIYVIHNNQRSAFYVLSGIAYSYERTDEEIWRYQEPPLHHRNREHGLVVGAGLGGALKIRDQIWIAVDLAIVAYRNSIFPSPQIAAHYMLW